jgi:hypothetical protein
MVSILTSSPNQVQQKTLKLVFVFSSLSMQHEGEREKIGWLEIRIMCPIGEKYLRGLVFQWASSIKIQLNVVD